MEEAPPPPPPAVPHGHIPPHRHSRHSMSSSSLTLASPVIASIPLASPQDATTATTTGETTHAQQQQQQQQPPSEVSRLESLAIELYGRILLSRAHFFLFHSLEESDNGNGRENDFFQQGKMALEEAESLCMSAEYLSAPFGGDESLLAKCLYTRGFLADISGDGGTALRCFREATRLDEKYGFLGRVRWYLQRQEDVDEMEEIWGADDGSSVGGGGGPMMTKDGDDEDSFEKMRMRRRQQKEEDVDEMEEKWGFDEDGDEDEVSFEKMRMRRRQEEEEGEGELDLEPHDSSKTTDDRSSKPTPALSARDSGEDQWSRLQSQPQPQTRPRPRSRPRSWTERESLRRRSSRDPLWQILMHQVQQSQSQSPPLPLSSPALSSEEPTSMSTEDQEKQQQSAARLSSGSDIVPPGVMDRFIYQMRYESAETYRLRRRGRLASSGVQGQERERDAPPPSSNEGQDTSDSTREGAKEMGRDTEMETFLKQATAEADERERLVALALAQQRSQPQTQSHPESHAHMPRRRSSIEETLLSDTPSICELDERRVIIAAAAAVAEGKGKKKTSIRSPKLALAINIPIPPGARAGGSRRTSLTSSWLNPASPALPSPLRKASLPGDADDKDEDADAYG